MREQDFPGRQLRHSTLTSKISSISALDHLERHFSPIPTSNRSIELTCDAIVRETNHSERVNVRNSIVKRLDLVGIRLENAKMREAGEEGWKRGETIAVDSDDF